jgi:hypothetical protein
LAGNFILPAATHCCFKPFSLYLQRIPPFSSRNHQRSGAGKDILAFLLSFNTSTMLTVLLYDWLTGFPADVSPECKIIADKKESGKNSNE